MIKYQTLNPNHKFDYQKQRRKTVSQRFWEKVEVVGKDECWNWIFAKRNGYGVFSFNGKPIMATRFVFIEKGIVLNSEIDVLHKCDNPSCVNPNHLRLGTARENAADMLDRNREARGEDLPQSKLNNEKVKKIRILLKKRMGQSKIAKMFKVNQSLISYIKSG